MYIQNLFLQILSNEIHAYLHSVFSSWSFHESWINRNLQNQCGFHNSSCMSHIPCHWIILQSWITTVFTLKLSRWINVHTYISVTVVEIQNPSATANWPWTMEIYPHLRMPVRIRTTNVCLIWIQFGQLMVINSDLF